MTRLLRMETKHIRDLRSVHGDGKVLLIGEEKQENSAKLFFVQHALKAQRESQ